MARCSVCGAPAVAYVRAQRRHLCAAHYVEYVEGKVKRALRRYGMVSKGSLVLVSLSGGKDSAALLGALVRASREMGFRLVAMHIDLGIGEYSRKSREAVEAAVEKLGVPLIVVSVKDVLGVTVPELARRARRPVCSVCGMVKRYIANAVAVELGADALALGHNADDLAVYNMKSFINQDLEAISKLGPKTESIPGKAVSRIRPLYEVYEKEAFLYAYLTGVPFIHDECPHVDPDSLERNLKEELNRLEEKKPGIKMSMMRRLAKRIRDYPRPQGEVRSCSVCGLISSGDTCSFCRLTGRILGEPMGPRVRDHVRRLVSELRDTVLRDYNPPAASG